MSRFASRSLAALAALAITLVAMQQVIAVPAIYSAAPAHALA